MSDRRLEEAHAAVGEQDVGAAGVHAVDVLVRPVVATDKITSKLQQAKEYCVELGGTIVLIRVKPPSSAAHRCPLVVLVDFALRCHHPAGKCGRLAGLACRRGRPYRFELAS